MKNVKHLSMVLFRISRHGKKTRKLINVNEIKQFDADNELSELIFFYFYGLLCQNQLTDVACSHFNHGSNQNSFRIVSQCSKKIRKLYTKTRNLK